MRLKQNRYAISFAKEVVEALQLPNECFKEIGKINGAATEKGMRHNGDYSKHLSKLGEKIFRCSECCIGMMCSKECLESSKHLKLCSRS